MFAEKVERGIFKPVLRFLNPEIAEERMAEAVAQTWAMFVRYAKRGIELPDAILVHSARQRARDLGRSFVPVGGGRKPDVLDHRLFMKGVTSVSRLDVALPDEEVGHMTCTDDHLHGDVADVLGLSRDPTQHLDAALDLERWLAQLTPRDHRLVELRFLGLSLEEIGDDVGMCLSGTCRQLQVLGIDLAAYTETLLPKLCRRGRPPPQTSAVKGLDPA